MDEKINFLLDNGLFRKIVIDEKGYGTFRNDPEEQKIHNSFLEQARSLKREGDTIVKQNNHLNAEDALVNTERAVEFYIRSIFSYIRGYKHDEPRIHKNNSIIHWKGLHKYIKDIQRMTESRKTKDFLQSCLFAIKFHYLDLEITSGDSADHHKYFTKEFHSLFQQFNTLEHKIKLDDLERFYFENEVNKDL